MKKWKYVSLTAVLGSALLLGACAGTSNEEAENSGNSAQQKENGEGQITGSVMGDGSSTVAPITEALVEEYAAVQPNVQVSVGVSGTGGGFEKFIAGETDFSNASRDIKEEEAAALKDAGIEYTKFEIAYDGITVVVNSENDWATDLTIDQLKKFGLKTELRKSGQISIHHGRMKKSYTMRREQTQAPLTTLMKSFWMEKIWSAQHNYRKTTM